MNDAAADALFGLPVRDGAPAAAAAPAASAAASGRSRGERRRSWEPAAELPVARVLVDIPLPHLDRPFDFAVPESMSAEAQPGVRVRVRFSGQLLTGWLLERAASSEHAGELAPLAGVVSPVAVLTPEIAALARAVADRYAGSAADVLRLAVPPRHARAERAALATPATGAAPDDGEPRAAGLATGPATGPATGLCATSVGAGDSHGWADLDAGAQWLAQVERGAAPRAVVAVPPGRSWPQLLATSAAAAVASGRSAVLVVPDARDLERLGAALRDLVDPDLVVELRADLGPEARYRRWLRGLLGQARVVLGTRSAVFAPVERLGLVAVWDDGDDLHAEPRAPYPHVREVAALRAHLQDAALLVAGHSVTSEAVALTDSGWAQLLAAPRDRVRAGSPRLSVAGDDPELERDPHAAAARLPSAAVRAARAALSTGPVLVQVPRGGYLPAVACQQCRQPARCPRCSGPLQLPADGPPSCAWCGTTARHWRCPACGSPRLRAQLVGARRTAEELGRAFPGVPVVVSGRHGGDDVLAEVPGTPALVVATPGAEPLAEGGYAAALLLDGWLLLSRPELRAAEEALRRWLNAAALVRPASAGGQVVVMAPAELPAVQALLRWDPVWLARRELDDRREVHLPPVARLAEVVGPETELVELAASLDLPPSAERLGPVPLASPAAATTAATPESGQARLLLRVPRQLGSALSAALHAEAAARSLRKDPFPLRVRIDPHDLT